ncbi:hypothetical protein CBS101457_002468 [Exobasidium rhododendri]|nr:hypothetical protein CBS101457_002468 [Exobasidium rhododendri]
MTQKVDSEVSRGMIIEDELARVKEDRDRQRLAVSNLEQAYDVIKLQLQEKDKGKRLMENDTERLLQKNMRASEEEMDVLRARNRVLEEQLRSAQSAMLLQNSLQSDSRRRSGDPDTKVIALENEVVALKANNERLRQHASSSAFASPSQASPHGRNRRPRASSVSQASSSEMQQLRDSNGEAKAKIDQWETRAVKAEREVLKVSNERIASSKASDLIIADYKSKVADLDDEVTFQRRHLKDLEREVETLQSEQSRAMKLQVELEASLAETSQLSVKLKESETTINELQRDAEHFTMNIKQIAKEKDLFREQAEDVNKRLTQREREIEAAKKQFRRLSSSVRKTMLGVANVQVVGDETCNNTVAFGGADESLLMNMTVSRDFECDWFDEMEQLTGYLIDMKEPLEFAKVEREVLEKSAALEREELRRAMQVKETELSDIREVREQQAIKQIELEANYESLQVEKSAVEATLQNASQEVQDLRATKELLEERVTSLQNELHFIKSEGEQGAADRRSLEEETSRLKLEREACQTEICLLEKRCEDAGLEKDRMYRQMDDCEGRLQTGEVDMAKAVQRQEDLLDRIKVLELEKGNGLVEIDRLSQRIVALDLECKSAVLVGMKVTLEMRGLQLQYRREAARASDELVAALAFSQEALRLEGEQWQAITGELQTNVRQCHEALKSAEGERATERKSHVDQVIALKREVEAAEITLEEKSRAIVDLELDLQANRANQQLAEDVLRRLQRDVDVTVNDDLTPQEAAKDAADLKSQLIEASGSIQRWQEKQETMEMELRTALEEVVHWKEKCESRMDKISGLCVEKDRAIESVSKLREALQESEASKNEAQTSMMRMEEEMLERITSLQKMQLDLQTAESAILDIQEEKSLLVQQIEKLRVEMSEDAMRRSQGDSRQIQDLKTQVASTEADMESLREVVDDLKQTLHHSQAEREASEEQLRIAKAQQSLSESSAAQLSDAHRQTSWRLDTAMESVQKLELAVTTLEEEGDALARRYTEVTSELKEARDGYEILKEQLSRRNDEYWQNKEELAEWQERYEKSQADVKMEEGLDESLRIAVEELEVVKQVAKKLQSKCQEIEEEALLARKDSQESRQQVESLMAELESVKSAGVSQTSDVEQQLILATSSIEQLEQELAYKAQECEDADDKELALRKNNKKLTAKVATLQAKMEKMQAQGQLQRATKTIPSSHSAVNNDRAVERVAAQEMPHVSPVSRKRSAPDEESSGKEAEENAATTTRAIYAPKPSIAAAPSSTTPTTSTTKVVRKVATLGGNSAFLHASKPSNHAILPPSAALHPSVAGGNPTSKRASPSDLIVKRLKSPSKEGTLQDRTNLQSRQASASTQEATMNKVGQDNHFLTKLNRFRPTSSQVMPARPTPVPSMLK